MEENNSKKEIVEQLYRLTNQIFGQPVTLTVKTHQIVIDILNELEEDKDCPFTFDMLASEALSAGVQIWHKRIAELKKKEMKNNNDYN